MVLQGQLGKMENKVQLALLVQLVREASMVLLAAKEHKVLLV
jgi:hypothetical protein